VVADKTFPQNESPIISVVVPIFDQETIILRHLQAIIQCMSKPFELILINDASSDNTDIQIRKFLEWSDSNNGTCSQVKYFKNLWPWFETRCDDFGIREAKCSYVLEIQADMLIKQKGFDDILLDLMEKDSSLLALSGRGTHKFDLIKKSIAMQNGSEVPDEIFSTKYIKKVKYKFIKEINLLCGYKNLNNANITDNPNHFENQNLNQIKTKIFPNSDDFKLSGSAGFLGTLVELLPYDNSSFMNDLIESESKRIWYGETVMRGPLMINRRLYLAVGGFNTNGFYLGNDDHDLFVRSRRYDYRVGFTPLKFASPLILGNARKKRKVKSKIWSKIHRKAREKAYYKSELKSYFAESKHGDLR
jgi:glycosyltransferase involved in cell wall biosynthesis